MATLSAVQMQEGDPTGQNAAAFDVGGLKVQAVSLVDPDTGAAKLPLTDAELRAAPINVAITEPTAHTVTITSVQTDASGTAWADFTSAVCKSLDIVNSTNIDIEYRRNGTGVGMPIPARSSRSVLGITNADEISIRRIDQLTTQVTIHAEVFA